VNGDKAAPIRCFAPVAATGARLLILGSMPGVQSLRLQQYYGHPRNAFWEIFGELIGAGPALPYAERLQKLQSAGIALWDVLATCERRGSLDSNIVEDSIVANDFVDFFATCREVKHVFFNGAKAETAWRRHVRGAPAHLALRRLPSTSPAHASLDFSAKLSAWSAVLQVLKPADSGK